MSVREENLQGGEVSGVFLTEQDEGRPKRERFTLEKTLVQTEMTWATRYTKALRARWIQTVLRVRPCATMGQS